MKRKFYHIVFLISIILGGCNSQPNQLLKLQPLFSKNMVLQQGQKIPVWGTAKANSQISVSFRKQSFVTNANAEGKWLLELNEEKTGTGDTLTITSGNETITFSNIAVGEVWLASGQSNMEVTLINNWAPINNAQIEVEKAQYPNIRFVIINRNTTSIPVDTTNTDGWQICSPQTAGSFSAVAYFFARELHKNTQVPVGIIQSAWGGTAAQAWTSKESLKLLKDFAGDIENIEALPLSINEQTQRYNKANLAMHNEMAKADVGISENDSIFKSIDLDDNNWLEMQLPGKWEETTFGEFDGSVWFRKEVIIPNNYDGSALNINLGQVDDFDEVWFNGIKIGESERWESKHQYPINKKLIKKGINVITLRITDLEGEGGFNGQNTDFCLTNSSGLNIDISGTWKIHAGYNLNDIKTKPISPNDPNRVTSLFNGMINPLIPFGIKGVIWYQGESNTYAPEQYRRLFPILIKDWRKQWEQGVFPFYFVQLPNYMKRNKMPTTDNWAELREAQDKTLNLPNTAMAVTIDLGDAKNIHPGNKQDVGLRLAKLALHNIYQFDIPHSGPVLKEYEIKKNKLILSFDYVYNGLQTSDNESPTGFSIAGENEEYYWANAKIINNKIELSSTHVNKPKHARYAWSANPACNLVNSEQLPAKPFSTKKFNFTEK